MNESLTTFLFELANFIALAAALAWLFFNPVRKALAEQSAKARRQEEEAARKLADAETVRHEIDSRRATLSAELDEIRGQARQAAKEDAERIMAEARIRTERERATLRRDALNIEQSQMAKIAQAVAGSTHATLKRFLQQMEGPEIEQMLLRAACRELQVFSNNSLAPVVIESALPLDDASKKLIGDTLGAAAKSTVFRTLPDLIGGLRISTAHGLIDASILGLADYAEQSLTAEMAVVMREVSERE